MSLQQLTLTPPRLGGGISCSLEATVGESEAKENEVTTESLHPPSLPPSYTHQYHTLPPHPGDTPPPHNTFPPHNTLPLHTTQSPSTQHTGDTALPLICSGEPQGASASDAIFIHHTPRPATTCHGGRPVLKGIEGQLSHWSTEHILHVGTQDLIPTVLVCWQVQPVDQVDEASEALKGCTRNLGCIEKERRFANVVFSRFLPLPF